MRETSDRDVRVLFWERRAKEMLEFYFERDSCNVSKERDYLPYI